MKIISLLLSLLEKREKNKNVKARRTQISELHFFLFKHKQCKITK